jgi:hypothetical protein
MRKFIQVLFGPGHPDKVFVIYWKSGNALAGFLKRIRRNYFKTIPSLFYKSDQTYPYCKNATLAHRI